MTLKYYISRGFQNQSILCGGEKHFCPCRELNLVSSFVEPIVYLL
jgi:hypothetical protein